MLLSNFSPTKLILITLLTIFVPFWTHSMISPLKSWSIII
jgi:hypothetical protein